MSRYYICTNCISEMIDTNCDPKDLRVNPKSLPYFSLGSLEVFQSPHKDISGDMVRELWERNSTIEKLEQENQKLREALRVVCSDLKSYTENDWSCTGEEHLWRMIEYSGNILEKHKELIETLGKESKNENN